ncbi:hypothetical protein FS837_007581 [Tulasnella sp. UAMH 9824]|nr:hypothetical protein FS837_007581 [Tulasnella sp. UAMH 9824]
MAPHHLHAYYHNIFNSDVPDSKRFRWKHSLAAGGYIPPTILVGASHGNPDIPEKTSKETATKSTQPGKRSSSSKKSDKRASAAPSDDEDEMPTASKKRATTSSTKAAKHLSSAKNSKKRPSAGTSDDESEMSTESDTPSPGEPQDSSDDDQIGSDDDNPALPDVDSRQHSSQHQSSKTQDKGKAVDPTERPLEQQNRVVTTATAGPAQLPQNPSTSRPNAATDPSRSLYRFQPSGAKIGKLIPSTYSTYVAGLTLRENGQNMAGLSQLPTLHKLIQRSAELDCAFTPAHTPPSLPWCTDDLPPKTLAFCQELTTVTRPIPTFLQFTNACSTDGQQANDVLESVMKHVEDTVDYLQGLNMAEPGAKMLPIFSSWTPILLVCTRLLAFVARTPPDDYPDIMEHFKLSHRRTVELAVISLIIRYCSSTVSGIVSTLPAPTASSTIANALAVVGSAWLRWLASLSRPVNKLDLRQVLASSWAAQVNLSGNQDWNLPFFNLNSASLRWLSFTRTSKLKAEIMSFHKALQQDEGVFRDRSVFEQFTIVGSICAIHTGVTRKTNDKDWLRAIDQLRSRIDKLARTSDYETVHLNPPPPPTLIGTTPLAPPAQCPENVPASLPHGSEAGSACPQTPPAPSPMPSTSTKQHAKVVEPSNPTNRLDPQGLFSAIESPAHGASISSLGDHAKESRSRHPQWMKPLTPAGPSTGQIGAKESDQSLPEALEQRTSYMRPRTKRERSSWIAGDILRVVHEGGMRQVMVRQKGPVPSNLVLTSPESRTILLAPDGTDSPLPSFDTYLLIERGPSDLRMHPNCFVREQPLPPFIPLEEITTGHHDEYFKRLWQQYPDEPTPPDFDKDFIKSYEEYETADRLKNLLLDRSRRELFRSQCNLPISAYDIRLAKLIEEVTALAALKREPTTSPARPRSTSTSSSTSSHSSKDSNSPINVYLDLGENSEEPSRSLEELIEESASTQLKSVIRYSSSSDSSNDDEGVQPSFVTSSRISPDPKVQAPDLLIRPGNSGIHVGPHCDDTLSKQSECNSQSDERTEFACGNEAAQAATTANHDSLNEETGSSSVAPAPSQSAWVEGAHVENTDGERPEASIADFDDTDGKPITGLENPQHRSPKAATKGLDNVPLPATISATVAQVPVNADTQASEQEFNIPTSKPRGPAWGPRPPPGPPTRSSPRILASVAGNNSLVPTPNNPAAEADVHEVGTVGRNTRSRSKSTSGNTPATPRGAKAAKKPTPKLTTTAAGKKTRNAAGKR